MTTTSSTLRIFLRKSTAVNLDFPVNICGTLPLHHSESPRDGKSCGASHCFFSLAFLQVCAADIHPAARIGRGILMASGCDIGRVRRLFSGHEWCTHRRHVPASQFLAVYNVSHITSDFR